MKRKNGFTLLEVVIVMVIMGIIAKFGVEFLAQAYSNYIHQKISTELQDKSSVAVEKIATLLKYRVKDSVIVRDAANFASFKALEGESTAVGYDVLEWVAYDIDSFRGDGSSPFWSGIIDKEYSKTFSAAGTLPDDVLSPGTDTTKVDNVIKALSNNKTTINDAAIYLMSSQSDVFIDYGWDGNAITDQVHAMHPINSDSTNVSKFKSPASNTQTLKEINAVLKDARYKLCWTAYAIVFDPNNKKLWLYYNYQPWNGEKYSDVTDTDHKVLIMDNVSTFRKRQSFGVMKIQVCTKSPLVKTADKDEEQYSVCKEKTIY